MRDPLKYSAMSLQIQISKDNLITISGERVEEHEEDEGELRRIERAYGTFMRTFQLPGMSSWGQSALMIFSPEI